MIWKNGQKKHGDSRNGYIYRIWCGMKTRCLNENRKQYKDWGGRGISIYPDWLGDYEIFKSWIIENIGHKPSEKHQLDRINNDGNYEPGNLRWGTRSEQNYNRRFGKLSIESVKEIKWLLSLNKYTHQIIADDYNVSRQTVSDINSGRRRKNIKI